MFAVLSGNLHKQFVGATVHLHPYITNWHDGSKNTGDISSNECLPNKCIIIYITSTS